MLGGADQRPHDRDRPQGRGDGADDVEAARTQRGLVQRPPGQGQHGEADRDVDEERPAPRAEVRDGSAEQQAERHASGGDGTEEGESPVASRLVRGAGGEQGEHAGCGECGTDALGAASRDEPRRVLRETAGQGRKGEDRQADLEGAAPPEDVAEPATEQQQPTERQRVGVEHPREPCRAEAERVWMCGRATFTTVASRISISWATSTIAMPAAARPAFGGRSVGSAWWRLRPVLDRVLGAVEEEGGERVLDIEWEVLFWPDGRRRLMWRATPVRPPRYGDSLRLASHFVGFLEEVPDARRCATQPRPDRRGRSRGVS